MKTITLKTNIMCASCIEKVTPALNHVAGEGHWTVDTQTPDKKLIVQTDKEVNGEDIIAALKAVGYKAEAVS